jgi:hypothetical protein
MDYEAPAVAAITRVGEPLIGTTGSVTPNPQWGDEPTAS